MAEPDIVTGKYASEGQQKSCQLLADMICELYFMGYSLGLNINFAESSH